jgi:hypothetical protein
MFSDKCQKTSVTLKKIIQQFLKPCKSKYEKIKETHSKDIYINSVRPQEDALIKKIRLEIIKKVKKRFSLCNSDIQNVAEKIIAKTIVGDKDAQIILLPYFFKKSLGSFASSVTDECISNLGAANMFGWMAYTIYDDFLDGEGSVALLPVANICLRESDEIFRLILPKESGFAEFSKNIFDTIDRICNIVGALS